MKKVALADVFWTAANAHLVPREWSCYERSRWRFSCDSIQTAAGPSASVRSAAMRLATQLGLPTDAENRFDLFDQFEDGEARQGVRYIWLLLAMHVAEDEGIMVEVAS